MALKREDGTWTHAKFMRTGTVTRALESGGGGGNSGGMESRISKLEAIIPTLATKADIGEVRADLHKVSSEMKGWFIGTALLVLVGMFTIANIMITNVRSLDARPSVAAAQPIIIQVPSPVSGAVEYRPANGKLEQPTELEKTPAERPR